MFCLFGIWNLWGYRCNQSHPVRSSSREGGWWSPKWWLVLVILYRCSVHGMMLAKVQVWCEVLGNKSAAPKVFKLDTCRIPSLCHAMWYPFNRPFENNYELWLEDPKYYSTTIHPCPPWCSCCYIDWLMNSMNWFSLKPYPNCRNSACAGG